VEYTYHDPKTTGPTQAEEAQCGTLPSVFQRPNSQMSMQDDVVDFDKVDNLRKDIEDKLKICHADWLEVDTSLCYHLISALGGELRYFTDPASLKSDNGVTKYWFALPSRLSRHAVLTNKVLTTERILKPTAKPITKKRNSPQIHGALAPHQEPEKAKDTPTHTKIISKVSPEIVTAGGVFASANAKPLVLVVEDTVICARLVCKMLSMLGCITAHAINGKVAVEMLQDASAVGTYDLILMDLRMPVMDGFEATETIRKVLKMDTPIYALTGESGDGYRQRTEELGFTGFFNKPLRKAKLQELIKSVVDAKQVSCEPKKCEPPTTKPGQEAKEILG